MPLTITEFLEARIAEDEARAKNAADSVPSERSMAPTRGPAGESWTSDGGMVSGQDDDLWDCEGSDTLCTSDEVADHIARHDPARVLAECATKRAIIEAFNPECPDLDPYVGRDVIAMLAAVYKDHPDYQQEWARG